MYYSDGNRYYGSGGRGRRDPWQRPIDSASPARASVQRRRSSRRTSGRPSIVLGQTFTITLRVENRGHASDDGRVAVSFPSLTNPADPQWVSGSGGDDGPGLPGDRCGGPLPIPHAT